MLLTRRFLWRPSGIFPPHHPRAKPRPVADKRITADRPELRFHDLRPTGATLAAQAGATTAELQARLGHTTADAAMIYQHATSGRDAQLSRLAGW